MRALSPTATINRRRKGRQQDSLPREFGGDVSVVVPTEKMSALEAAKLGGLRGRGWIS